MFVGYKNHDDYKEATVHVCTEYQKQCTWCKSTSQVKLIAGDSLMLLAGWQLLLTGGQSFLNLTSL